MLRFPILIEMMETFLGSLKNQDAKNTMISGCLLRLSETRYYTYIDEC